MIDVIPKPTETVKTMPKFKVLVSHIELHCPIGNLLLLGPFFSIENFISALAKRKVSENGWGVDPIIL